MLAYIPFLLGPLTFGVIAMLTFIGSSVIFTIPVFATRGGAQLAWAGLVGFLLTAELAILVTLGILVDQGKIWS
ncbi:MAG: hypothetical protein ACR2HN_00255 [Tepidiformaceae bacterium]